MFIEIGNKLKNVKEQEYNTIEIVVYIIIIIGLNYLHNIYLCMTMTTFKISH